MIYGHNGKTVLVNFLFNSLKLLHFFSIVYNWTTEDVVKWLINYVHLPMYAESFRRNQFDGRMIPRCDF
jgi:hypothetical protein